MEQDTTLCGLTSKISNGHSATALEPLLEPCIRPFGHEGKCLNSLATWESERPAQHTGEGADTPSKCPVCQDFAERLAEAFVSRDMSKHTDLKVEHKRHLDAEHADWATRDANAYGIGSAFSWPGRLF